jgi:hypothetical protein
MQVISHTGKKLICAPYGSTKFGLHQVPWARILEQVAQPLQIADNGRLEFALRQVCLSLLIEHLGNDSNQQTSWCKPSGSTF